jgi:hypothetical protein
MFEGVIWFVAQLCCLIRVRFMLVAGCWRIGCGWGIGVVVVPHIEWVIVDLLLVYV